MKINKFISILVILFFLLSCKTNKNETYKADNQENTLKLNFPKQLGYVSDFDQVFTIKQIENLNKILSDYELKTTNQIAIISITENLTENNFDQYALDLSNSWRIGTAEKNNGLTIIFSSKLRKIRICTGRGTEKILTDQICEEILNKKILPEFKKDNYYSGISNGINEFIKTWD